MNRIEALLKTHPNGPKLPMGSLLAAIKSCLECIGTCNACGDACLHEDHVEKMLDCVRTCFDCAEVCGSTAALLSRVDSHSRELLIAQVEACQTACRVCKNECAKHAEMMEHCKHCRDACADCEQALGELLGQLRG